MSFYQHVRDNTATPLIAKYGRTFNFERVVKGAFDPATGQTIGDTVTTYTADAVKSKWTATERADSSIETNDIKLIAEAAGAYQVDDNVEIEGSSYKLVNVLPIKPGPTVVAYTLQARK